MLPSTWATASSQNSLVVAHPIASGQSAHELTIQTTGMLIVDIFDDAAFLQAGRAKTMRECAVLFPQPLLVDEQAEALLEGKLAHVGVFQLSAEGIGHSVQFHGVQFLDRRLVEHVFSPLGF